MSTGTTRTRFLDLVDALGTRRGLDLDLGQIEGPEVRAMAEQINTALKLAWEYYPWAQLVETLKVVPDAAGMVPHAQFDWRVLEVWSLDPDDPAYAGQLDNYQLPWQRTPSGIWLPTLPAEAWVRYRPAPPRMSGREWVNTRAYAAGESVYLASTGHCYRAGYAAPAGEGPLQGYWRIFLPAGAVATDGGIRLADGREEAWTGGTAAGTATTLGTFLGRTVTWVAAAGGVAAHFKVIGADGPVVTHADGTEVSVFIWTIAGESVEYAEADQTEAFPWLVQACPDFLVQAVLAGAEAAGLRTDGQVATSAMIEAAMEGWIEHEITQLTNQEQQQHGGVPLRRY